MASHCGWYNFIMTSKLSSTNPYLRDPKQRQRSVLRSVATSSAIEGIHAPFKTVTRMASASSLSSVKRVTRVKS